MQKLKFWEITDVYSGKLNKSSFFLVQSKVLFYILWIFIIMMLIFVWCQFSNVHLVKKKFVVHKCAFGKEDVCGT